MIAASRAPNLFERDGLSPLDRACRNKLMLGLFLPIQNCGWSASSAPRSTSWHFDYNARLAVRADELGFDLAFGLALWTGKGGLGGKIKYWETTLDPLMLAAGLIPLTSNLMLISTIHVLYGWHPLHLAKFGATLNHMSEGRWGLNIVTGYAPGEFQKFGRSQIDSGERYLMAGEFIEHMLQLWQAEENLTIEGRYWHMENAYCSPKLEGNSRPVLVNAGSSAAGLDFGASYCDLIFITSPAGAEIEAALESLPAHIKAVKDAARRHGRDIRTIINPLVICRDTQKEVEDIQRSILAGVDHEAIDGIFKSQQSGNNKSWQGHKAEQRAIGGNIQLFGTPDQIVDYCLRLSAAGVDGIHLSFFDFAPDLEYFGAKVLPRLVEAGLRTTAGY